MAFTEAASVFSVRLATPAAMAFLALTVAAIGVSVKDAYPAFILVTEPNVIVA